MSTHTNINMSTAASNFAADLNSEPISFSEHRYIHQKVRPVRSAL